MNTTPNAGLEASDRAGRRLFSDVKALQAQVDAVRALADDWYAGDGYETGIPHIDEVTNNRWSAKQECANEIRAAIGDER